MRKGLAGFTLVEVTIILLVLFVLAAILLPVAQNYVNRARLARVREDVGAIGTSIAMMLEDIGEACLLKKGHGDDFDDPPAHCEDNRVDLVVGDGDIPALGSSCHSNPMNEMWTEAVNFENIDFLEYHIISNRPGNDPNNRYRTPNDIRMPPLAQGNEHGIDFARKSSSGFNSRFAWRGAYMTAPLEADPWGNRYMVNVQFLDPQPRVIQNAAFDVFVLSAGADEQVDTWYAQDGAVNGGDDHIYVISGSGH